MKKDNKELMSSMEESNKQINESLRPVSYTHLDVYKRQLHNPPPPSKEVYFV